MLPALPRISLTVVVSARNKTCTPSCITCQAYPVGGGVNNEARDETWLSGSHVWQEEGTVVKGDLSTYLWRAGNAAESKKNTKKASAKEKRRGSGLSFQAGNRPGDMLTRH